MDKWEGVYSLFDETEKLIHFFKNDLNSSPLNILAAVNGNEYEDVRKKLLNHNYFLYLAF